MCQFQNTYPQSANSSKRILKVAHLEPKISRLISVLKAHFESSTFRARNQPVDYSPKSAFLKLALLEPRIRRPILTPKVHFKISTFRARNQWVDFGHKSAFKKVAH